MCAASQQKGSKTCGKSYAYCRNIALDILHSIIYCKSGCYRTSGTIDIKPYIFIPAHSTAKYPCKHKVNCRLRQEKTAWAVATWRVARGNKIPLAASVLNRRQGVLIFCIVFSNSSACHHPARCFRTECAKIPRPAARNCMKCSFCTSRSV